MNREKYFICINRYTNQTDIRLVYVKILVDGFKEPWLIPMSAVRKQTKSTNNLTVNYEWVLKEEEILQRMLKF